MKRIWTIWGITALTAVILMGAVVFAAVACAGYADGLPTAVISVLGGIGSVIATALVAGWLNDEVPR